jgi:hypothetical protein
MIIIPNKNLELNISYGEVVNKITKEYVLPEVEKRKIKQYEIVGIEILKDENIKIYFNYELKLMLEFKDKQIQIKDKQKKIKIDLHNIKNIKWNNKELQKDSAKIVIWYFNKDYCILCWDLKNRKDIISKFKGTKTYNLRGGGFLPLKERKKEKDVFFQGWKKIIEDELSAMWLRNITVSQKYKGPIVYDGNYFDLFNHAQGLYILGYYYPTIILCRSAIEQALISILLKSGHPYEIYIKGSKK